MDRSDFYQGVRHFLGSRTGVERGDLTSNANLIQEGIVDSVLLTELILYVEDVTSREIDVDNFRLSTFSTMESIYDHYVGCES